MFNSQTFHNNKVVPAKPYGFAGTHKTFLTYLQGTHISYISSP